MVAKNFRCIDRVDTDLSESFDTKWGFRHGDALSCDCFNILTEKIIYATELKHNGTICNKSVVPLAYADNIDVIGKGNWEVSAAFSRFIEEVQQMGLEINENKAK